MNKTILSKSIAVLAMLSLCGTLFACSTKTKEEASGTDTRKESVEDALQKESSTIWESESENETTSLEEEESTQKNESEKEKNYEEMLQIRYNNIEFSVGDKASEVLDQLGEQAAQVENVPSNFAGGNVDVYTFYNMVLQVKKDTIICITLEEKDTDTSKYDAPETVTGIKIGSSTEDLMEAYAGYCNPDMGGYIVANGGNRTIEGYAQNGKITKMILRDSTEY